MVKGWLISAIGLLGGILALAGLIFSQWAPSQIWVATICEVLAIFCLTLYLARNWERLKSFSTQRSTRMGANSLLAILLLVGILAIINFLADRHGGRWDLSESQHFSLAPQTYRVLGELDRDIKVTVFSHSRSPGFGAYRDLLESYTHGNSRISVDFVDPESRPQLAREYHITQLDTAVFQSGSQTIHITKPTEVELTSALIRVTRGTKKRILFLQGHGEREIDNRERDGFSLVQEALLKQGYEVDRVSLLQERAIPEGTAVLVIAGPRHSISSPELERITEFLNAGGQALLLVDPETTTGLETLTAQWGVTLGPGIIVDQLDRMPRGSPTALRVRRFTDHEITRDFTEPVIFPVARMLTFDGVAGQGREFTPLAHTSEKSWAERNFDDKNPVFNENEDIPGPLILAAILESKDSLKNGPISQGSLAILGNSTFASNAYLKFPGNTDFFLNTIAWLAGEKALVSITPKNSVLRPFIPNPTQEHMLLAIQVFSVPMLLALLGYTIWRRRNRL